MDYNKPIPTNISIKGWQEIPIIENKEPLICLDDYAPKYICTSPEYYLRGIAHAIKEQYARVSVAKRLLNAAQELPEGYRLLIWDAWRPLEVQQALFDNFLEKLKSKFGYDETTALNKAQKFVSLPSSDPFKPSPHFTGGAVDLTIVDKNSEPLNMGTGFDYFENEARTSFFEEGNYEYSKDKLTFELIRNNRRLLFNVMVKSGFNNYPNEWWHYDYGNQFWAVQKKCISMFSGINRKIFGNEFRK